MRVRLKLRPGQRGTKRLVEQYGEALVCVRYRYDAARKKRYKTVELTVATADWEPPDPPYRPSDIVCIMIAPWERELRLAVKQQGGQWQPRLQVWRLRFERVLALGLTDRIVEGRRKRRRGAS